ncbi:thermonuclease family protein [Gracilibacillus kekensis]|uniref:Micrococcal nuclease n=1 Tax=Gracilibacillus kekensis TaxID=1027249 RepID=A0A1M7IC66_9BACI|nr:thermonuclease family protein [Gracilibacillus kekensis]SHM38352.1 micrococcal nuclease [Gracilibacillus kekensis]
MYFRKWMIMSILIFLILTGCGTEADKTFDDNENNYSAADPSTAEEETNIDNEDFTDAEVKRVVDGDTVKIQIEGREETVRLLLVDTPETKHPNLPEQPYGQEATDFAVEKLAGKTIQIEYDGPKRDHYDRLLGYIWVDGENFNKMLLEVGLARYAYVYEPPYTHQKELKQAEQQASESGIGIWSEDNYVTNDGFNHQDVSSKPNTNSDQEDVYYAKCAEAQEAGVTPLYEGDPGYGIHMDGDRDGVACE